MAKSTGYFGLRRGSTKSHTFSVVGGKQITKDRVEGGKNPRTPAQMRQRCIMATLSQTYKAMKEVCDHSFEGLSAGNDCMNRFKEINASLLRSSAQYENGFFGFNKWGIKGMMAGSYQLSDGTLAAPVANLAMESVNAVAKQGVIMVASGTSDAEIIEDFGFKAFGDIVTICVAYPKNDGSYGFGALRFTYKQGADLEHSLDFAAIGDINGASWAVTGSSIKELKVTFATSFDWAQDASPAETYTAAIASQKRNDKWLRSKAVFNVDQAYPTYEEAISTYPVGEEPFLNGSGEVEVGGVPTSSTTPSDPVVENPTLTIQKQGNGTSTITVAGSPMSESGTVAAGAAIAIDIQKGANETDTDPWATINGQNINLTLSDGHWTGSATMPSANATLRVDSGQTPSGGSGMDQN